MLYIAFVKNKPGTVLGNVDIMAKSRKWWNEGDRPAGLKTVGFYGALGTDTPDVYYTCLKPRTMRISAR